MTHTTRHPATDAALTALEADRGAVLAMLGDLVRIPGVSAAGPDSPALADSARAVAQVLAGAGLENVAVLPHPGAPPYVVGDWCRQPGRPTLLIYGHHDVQPPGNPARWQSPPWRPEERNGRLYGRGVADDKAGIMTHVAALRAWRAAAGAPPVNVKFIIEGEEEVGSPNLGAFLARHRERLAADCLVLTDTCNLDVGVPALTVSLRGLVVADVTVAALAGPVHSGIWGGPLPDPVQALAKILARLSDERGRVAIPAIADTAPSGPDGRHRALPFDLARFRAQAGLLDGVPLLTDGAEATYWATWNAPCVTVSAIDCVPLAESSNQIVPAARARVGVRLAPGQDAAACQRALVAFLAADPPFGCRVSVTPDCAGGGWQGTARGPWFDAAGAALAEGYGRPSVHIGCGGSIPFVEPFAHAMGGIPALLLGVEDPECRAHGENESLHLDDFAKACRAAVCLLGRAAALGTDTRPSFPTETP
ncbi:MAG: M20/M25/M40 family metallo-hydrolase [Nitrospirae bacterium]|nr:M20/M25/M40 family metallo-hydrolase [Nitrospirota bacterium]